MPIGFLTLLAVALYAGAVAASLGLPMPPLERRAPEHAAGAA